MLRKQARERREYIYRKSVEQKLAATDDKRDRVRAALENNERLPSDLRSNALQLQVDSEWKDDGGDGVKTHADNEYRWAGVHDPKIIITTSRDPSSKLKQFAKEMKLLFPNSQRMNRGHYEVKQLLQACRANDVTDFIMLHEHRGVPDGFIVSHLPYGPTAYFQLANVVMRHDIPDTETMSEAFPHLVFHNFTSPLGQRVMSILKYLYPVPKADSRRVITYANNEDYISYRHHTYKPDGADVELKEIGPRFEMKLYQIKLGTLDNIEAAETEWVLRPYMNTAKKRQFLAVQDDELDDDRLGDTDDRALKTGPRLTSKVFNEKIDTKKKMR